jgi:hypothetical protein
MNRKWPIVSCIVLITCVAIILIAGSAAYFSSVASPAEEAAQDYPGWKAAREAGIFGFPEDRFNYAFIPARALHLDRVFALAAPNKKVRLARSDQPREKGYERERGTTLSSGVHGSDDGHDHRHKRLCNLATACYRASADLVPLRGTSAR